MSAKQKTMEKTEVEKIVNTEKTESKEVVKMEMRITPEMAEMLLQGNFDHIKKHFGLTAFNKAKTKENKIALLKKYKALIDSMTYMAELL